jgi:hypothetical protein
MSRLTGRKHDRSRAVATVMVLWEDAAGREKFANARSFDISETGLCVELPEGVPLRSFVTLRADHFGIQGRAQVRHCSRKGVKYLIGLEFSAGLRWKPPSAEVEDFLREAEALAH